jgi:hypothetical protein
MSMPWQDRVSGSVIRTRDGSNLILLSVPVTMTS